MANESLPTWSCKIPTAPKDPSGFTVGEVFQLSCEGETVRLKEPISLRIPDEIPAAKSGEAPQKDPNAKYQLVLLKPLNLTDNKAEFAATSYIATPQDIKNFKLVDADNKEVLIPQITFPMKSVIDPSQQQKPEPFGPIGPMRMEWPVWIFFAALVVFVILVGWAVIFLRRRMQRRNLERNIKKYQSPLGSYHQFNKDLRVLKQGVVFTSHKSWTEDETKQYMAKLEEHFKMFLLREFIIPATSWSRALILKTLQKKDKRGFPHYQKTLQRALVELEKQKEAAGSLKPRDCEQITILSMQAVDQMWSHKKLRNSTKVSP